MSLFTDFFAQSGAVSGGVGGNIFANIRPPKFSDLGNSQNFSYANSWVTENFLIPNHIGYLLAINYGYKYSVSDLNNSAVWTLDDGVIASGTVVGSLIYNHILDKWYFSVTQGYSGYIGVYEVNILTGNRAKVAEVAPAFMKSFGVSGCYSYCNAEGLYEWHDYSTGIIRKYSQDFTEIQKKAPNSNANYLSSMWYYTGDCRTRASVRIAWRGQGTASGTTVNSDVPLMLIERYGSRRLVRITAEMVFSARDNTGATVDNWTPMVPDVSHGAYFGNSVRLGGIERNSAYIPDSYLLDRVDYDRWLNDVADALGMPVEEPFFGDWVNV